MTQSSTEIAKLNGLFKEVYADKIEKLDLDYAKLTKLIPFVSRAQQSGNQFHVPVVLANQQGFTYTGSAGTVQTLNGSVSMTTKDAAVDAFELILKAEIAYKAMSQSQNSKAAFMDATELLVENMLESHLFRVEVMLMYGGSGLAKIASSANVDTTHTTITITTASHAPLIWSGIEGAEVNFYNSTSLISSGADAIFNIDSVSVNARTAVISGTITGISALDTAIAANPNVLDMYFRGAYGNECPGIDKIATNSGALFGINATTYNRWRANVMTVTGALTMNKVLQASGYSANRGFPGDIDVLVHPLGWQDLNSDLGANRRHDQSYTSKEGENGVREITYFGQTGRLKIHAWAGIKAGDAYLLNTKHWVRPGSSEVTFNVPGKQDQFFTDNVDKNCFVLKTYSNQGIINKQPSLFTKITGITNSAPTAA